MTATAITAIVTAAIRVAIYVRISFDKMGDEHGVINQEATCRSLADARAYEVVRVFTDNDISASTGKFRPGYDALMKAAARGEFDRIIVFQSSRIWRNRSERAAGIEILRRAAISVEAVKGPSLDMSNAAGRMMAGVIGEFDTMEAEVKGERQRLANEQAAKNGKRTTGCPRPFGYADDHMTPDPAEAAAVVAGCRMVLGGGSVAGVAREWVKAGLRPPQAPFGPLTRHAWKRESVRVILANPRIAGLSAYHGEIVGKGQWAPLVPEETWRAVEAILRDPGRKHQRGVRTLLGGSIKCPCGNVVHGGTNSRGDQVYRCTPQTRDGRPGPHVTRKAAPVDAWISGRVIERLSRADAVKLLAAPKVRIDVGALREEAAAIRRNLDELAADRALGLVTRAQMIAATERGNARLDQISAALRDAGREDVLAPLIAADDVDAAWDELDLSVQRAVVTALFDVVLMPAGQGSRKFDPDTIKLEPKQRG